MNDRLLIPLLEIKDIDIRLSIINQAYKAVDCGIHAGSSFSAVIPLVCLYYSGTMNYCIENPFKEDADKFILSKGHGISALASIMADKGYFEESHLCNSRSIESILNGHPGPLLPGIPIATGPLGQGAAVALAIAFNSPEAICYCMIGDGEMQEGSIWETLMYAGAKKVKNLCLLIDCNNGQLDVTKELLYETKLHNMVKAFGFNVIEADGRKYSSMLEALRAYKCGNSDKPTAILCRTFKGFGAYREEFNKHKLTMDDNLYNAEITSQEQNRSNKEAYIKTLYENVNEKDRSMLKKNSDSLGLELVFEKNILCKIECKKPIVKLKKIPNAKKEYRILPLMPLENTKEYRANSIITDAMKQYAKYGNVVSIDADLASTSGLFEGVADGAAGNAHNVGIAETNMMNMAEGFALDGKNVWVSTFCPFFDWRAMRRIAIGWQERREVIERDGWLNENNNVDITFVATAPNLETQANGSTHMGNDDIMFMSNMAHLKIIDISCPRLLQSVITWIMTSDKGLVYLRIPRAPSEVIYNEDIKFEYGKSFVFSKGEPQAVVISSGRGVYEGLKAQQMLLNESIYISVVDMPSYDASKALEFYEQNIPVVFAEQNNGYLYSSFQKTLFCRHSNIETRYIHGINTAPNCKLDFIHSGTYQQLANKFGLDGLSLANYIMSLQ